MVNYQDLKKEIKLAALSIHADRKQITQERVGVYLKKSGFLRDPKVRQMINKIRYEIEEYERKTEDGTSTELK